AGNVSISFSAAFKTPATDRLRSVHRFNAILRGRGIRPSPVGQSAFRDAVKNHGYRSYRRIRQLLGLEAEDIVERYY
ncbi:MAG TPA: hypothetical protein VJX67_09810, partial [Blastocatellia bacterium]|nr:hypothetical protein [Blastocatellia bacterium]